jgi:hypothetical protein
MKTFLYLILPIACSNGVMGQCDCNPLPAPGKDETVIYANNISEIRDAIETASGKTTIYLNPGTYTVNSSRFIHIHTPDITLRSSSGNRNDGYYTQGIEIKKVILS